MTSPAPNLALRHLYREEIDRLQALFGAVGLAEVATSGRARAVEQLVTSLWQEHAAWFFQGVAAVAIAGFGRGELFPCSDVDLLFLCESESSRDAARDAMRAINQELWDSGLRASPVARTTAECGRFDPENLEFTISLLDGRLLAGDGALFERLQAKILPQLVGRECATLTQRLADVTRTRHRRYGNTIFHLEPNLKDGPGGLRDAHILHWLARIAELGGGDAESAADASGEAAAFLAAARCSLHYRSRRDDNVLSWEAQDELAMHAVGVGAPLSPAEWMREYFRHSRTLFRQATQALEHTGVGRSSLYRSFQHWRSRLSNEQFSVVEGRVYFRQASDARDPAAVLRLIAFVARHGVGLGLDTERRITAAHHVLAANLPQDRRLRQPLYDILNQPHAAEALRSLHALRLLTLCLPEFGAIDSLVLRDLYHRYTVDEHSFLAIDVLHRLRSNEVEWLQPFGALLEEVQQPELLCLALLLHDTGKGLDGSDHVHSSLQLATAALTRMQLPPEELRTVQFLIGAHLEMSATLRTRDIFDPQTVRELAAKVETPERLKMLTLLTLADIRAVNPEALTPWKAENLWRLYTGTSAHFARSVDDERLAADSHAAGVERVVALLPRRRAQLLHFLEGLPHRYLLSHSPEQVVLHQEMARQLPAEPAQLALRQHHGQYELTVVTADRDGLFSQITGILYAWGMDIAKASAFSNHEHVVVDSFYFKDRFHTLELNPPERQRFQRSVIDVLTGEAALEPLIEARMKGDRTAAAKMKVETRLRFDDVSSAGSSLLEIVTQDRPGLLHVISATLAAQQCSIEVALIETEGATALDVFYLSREGKKLTREQERSLEWTLMAELGDRLPSNW